MENKIEVIVGTYEEFLLGYKVTNAEDDNPSTLSITFSTRSHTASIRSIAIGRNYLISGGADDKIFIYDMKTRKEVNILMIHDGTVNALAFTPDNSHIISGGDDGRLAVTRVGTWQIGADWKKAHKGLPVTHISCHPSGKLALSIGTDLTLKTWNLITGRCAYTTNLKSRININKSPDCLQWSPDGNHFTLCGLQTVEILSVETAKTIKEIKVTSKPVSICWLSHTDLIVGLENGKLLMSSINEDVKDKYFEAHDKRVKGVAFLNDILGTTSSSGEVTLWNVNVINRKIKKIASINIGCRPTCIALLDLTQFDDDYKLIEQDVEEINESLIENEEKSKKSNLQNVGTVTVEYEDDDNDDDDDDVEKTEEEMRKVVKKIKLNKKRKSKNVNEDDDNIEEEIIVKSKKQKGFKGTKVPEQNKQSIPKNRRKKST